MDVNGYVLVIIAEESNENHGPRFYYKIATEAAFTHGMRRACIELTKNSYWTSSATTRAFLKGEYVDAADQEAEEDADTEEYKLGEKWAKEAWLHQGEGAGAHKVPVDGVIVEYFAVFYGDE